MPRTNTSLFQITAIISGQLVSQIMRLPGRLEDIQRRINTAIPEADSITIEHVTQPEFQGNRRTNAGYDAACHRDDLAVYE